MEALVTAREISERLNQQVETVCKHLLAGGVARGREYECGDLSGGAGKSLKVCLSGAKVGVWSDFASGEAGDLFDLWRMARGITVAETFKETKEWLGIKDGFDAPKKKQKAYKRPSRPSTVKIIKNNSRVMSYLTGDRAISYKAIQAYKVSEADALPEHLYGTEGPWVVFPFKKGDELYGIKYLHLDRPEGKKKIVAEPNWEPTLFGWGAIPEGSRSVVICEGELDAMSLYDYGFSALSVPMGGGKGNKQKWIETDWADLAAFDEIFLCLDGDAEGIAGAEEIASRIGVHRCRFVTLPEKDANTCLMKNIPAEVIATCFEKAETRDPDELKPAKSYTDQIMEVFYPTAGKAPGFDLPWKNVDLRIYHGELSIWTGVSGHGKSVLLGQVMSAAVEQGERCCIASFEMQPAKTLARMMRQEQGSSLPMRADVLRLMDDWGDNVWVFDLVGTGKLNNVLEVFEYAFRRYGVRQFVIDSFMKLGVSEDDSNQQATAVDRLAEFCNKFQVSIHLVAHSRKLADEFSPPRKMDVRGTGTMTNLADNVFTVFRHKAKEEKIKELLRETGGQKGAVFEELDSQPDTFLFCDKCREDGEKEGRWGLYFDKGSLRYSDDREKRFDHEVVCETRLFGEKD